MTGEQVLRRFRGLPYAGPAGAVLVLAIVLGLMTPRFLDMNNFVNIANQITVNIILAVGMTILITSGGIDLSVGANIALTGVIVAQFFRGMPEATAGGALVGIGIGILVGAVLGLFNGMIVAYLNAPPFITTLGTMSVFRGLALVFSGGRPLMGINPLFVGSFTGFIAGIPKQFLIALLVAGLGGYLLNRTTIGRVATAMGGNERCTVVSGLPTKRYKVLFYMITGGLAGIGALMLTAMMAVAEPIAGTFYELDAVAVVVIGGTSLMGGFGTMAGTIVGAILLGIVRNGLNLVGVPANYQQLIVGLIIMFAVIGVGRGKGVANER